MKTYTTEETAVIFHVTKYTVQRWIREGTVDAFKIGQRYIIKEEEIERLLNENN